MCRTIIQKINWTVYGKIARIQESNKSITYDYDAGGNRINKKVADNTGSTTTSYVRDAQGNVLGVYSYKGNTAGTLTQGAWNEQHLYGSSRIGMLTPNLVITTPLSSANYNGTNDHTEDAGKRLYELSNHLGNVMVTISDKKIGVDNNSDGIIDYYNADVVNAYDYYPFGMQMPGRTFNAASSYRYGFNGKENDNEVKNKDGSQIDFGARAYDPRRGQWLSVDSKAALYPGISTYAYALNTPINAIDPDGKLVIFVNGYRPSLPGVNIYREIKRDDKVFKGDKLKYWSGVDNKFMNRMEDHNAIYADGDAPTLIAKTKIGFNSRVAHGRQAGQDLISKINSGEVVLQKNDKGEVIESIKVVAHSMGYAYLIGMINELEKAGYKVEVSYNLAPENPRAGNIPGSVKRSVQYGSGENEPWYYQDRIAPQKKIKNVNEKVDIPDKNSNGENVPAGPYDSHAVSNYGKWIFGIPQGQEGAVAPRQDTKAAPKQ